MIARCGCAIDIATATGSTGKRIVCRDAAIARDAQQLAGKQVGVARRVVGAAAAGTDTE